MVDQTTESDLSKTGSISTVTPLSSTSKTRASSVSSKTMTPSITSTRQGRISAYTTMDTSSRAPTTRKQLNLGNESKMYKWAKSRKYQVIFNVRSRERTWQVRENLSQQLEHKQVPNRTEPGVWNGKRFLLASHIRCKCSMTTTRYSVKVKLGINVIKFVKSMTGMEVTVAGRGLECHFNFMFSEYSMPSHLSQETLARSSKECDIWSFEHDYPTL